VSETTCMLASSGDFQYEARGPFELKGLPGPRTLYSVR
jgi:hypothetical protein